MKQSGSETYSSDEFIIGKLSHNEKLPPNTEGAAILVGKVPHLDRALSAFVRLHVPQKLYPSIPDLPVPIRIIFILLSPTENYNNERISVGRTIAAMIADELFNAGDRGPFPIDGTLLEGCRFESLDEVTEACYEFLDSKAKE
ncbi:hypothetical protein KIN20_024205 [Parelaphostrongylus tenuis]|uniref:Band 3 cytoplasmic domain-containing protein n=1 Tax=Parelaphostrongylus tenuis TaxID=148309 RepID=A0AAD5N7Y4_PARTN|nr:hypothetical protein KIN20_024205 [Parelaphostrongylus tenuis]